jgi:hypothetical protein
MLTTLLYFLFITALLKRTSTTTSQNESWNETLHTESCNEQGETRSRYTRVTHDTVKKKSCHTHMTQEWDCLIMTVLTYMTQGRDWLIMKVSYTHTTQEWDCFIMRVVTHVTQGRDYLIMRVLTHVTQEWECFILTDVTHVTQGRDWLIMRDVTHDSRMRLSHNESCYTWLKNEAVSYW